MSRIRPCTARSARAGCALHFVLACAAEPHGPGQIAHDAKVEPSAGQAGVAPALPSTAAMRADAAPTPQPTAAGAQAGTHATALQPSAAGAGGRASAGATGAVAAAGAGLSGSGAAAAPGPAAAQPAPFLQPVERAGKYVLEGGAFSLELDPAHGARITRLALAGQNLLTGPEVDALNYGSTFWPSPQQRWNWPPVPELDSDAYTVQVEGDSLVCTSKAGMRAKVSVVKRVRASAAADVELVYSLKNEDSVPASWAPWEVTRVAAGGLSFFPSGERVVNAQLPVVSQASATWYKHDAAKVGAGLKLTADAADGFLAHVAGRTLFVKQFMDVPAAQQAPAPEAEIAIYAATGYVELEPQGAYTTLMPGESLNWRVRWRLAEVPQDVAIEVGSSKLLELARQLAKP